MFGEMLIPPSSVIGAPHARLRRKGIIPCILLPVHRADEECVFSPAPGRHSGGLPIGGGRDALYSSRSALRSSSSSSNADGSTLSDPRLDSELAWGHGAKTARVRPPPGRNSPRTIARSART